MALRETALPYEALAIFGIVLLNAVIGYPQESRAESAVAALRQMAAAQARVMRDGEPREVPSAEVVPGEILLLEVRRHDPCRCACDPGGVAADRRGGAHGREPAPRGDVTPQGGGVIEGALRLELERTLAVADRANNAVLREEDGRWTVQRDPTEGALRVAARKAGLDASALDARFDRVAEVPFSSERKLMSTVHADAEREERVLVFTKGAPDVLLARCSQELLGEGNRPLSDERRREIVEANEQLAGEALRTLGIAYRSLPAEALDPDAVDDRVERDLVFAELVGMIDPPRDEARDAVARARGAGIRPLMITGDHPKTASVIAAELGIAPAGARAVTGAELERIPDDAFARTVEEVSVYARVNPEHELRIVRALQRGGAIVAMTGDGVNDAPALKTADIGVAMGLAGTDVSREAADMVLADDNFATIVAAVEEGRAIFSNIRKFLRYLLSSNIGEVMTMFFGVLLAELIGLRAQEGVVVLPLLATQLLWVNLVEGSGDLRHAQTMAFTTLVLFQLFNVFNARSDE